MVAWVVEATEKDHWVQNTILALLVMFMPASTQPLALPSLWQFPMVPQRA